MTSPWFKLVDRILTCATLLGALWIFAEHQILPDVGEEMELFGILGFDEGGILAVALTALYRKRRGRAH
jgi:hypothetical protein